MSMSRIKPTHRSGAASARVDGDGGNCDASCGGEDGGEGAELRCACGSLLARYVDGKVELKCRRCKRTIWIAVGAEGELES
jgi:hypothetical protein